MNNFERQMQDAFLLFTLNHFSKDYRFYTMLHRGGLDEALKTRKKIDISRFFEMYYSHNYEFYCFDNRINCYRYILKDFVNHLDLPTWLLIEIKEEVKKNE